MKNLRAKLAARLRSRKGESLGEVLAALLIAALALTMLASVIYTSSNLIQNSKNTITSYNNANKALVLMTDTEEDDEVDGEGEIKGENKKITVQNNGGAASVVNLIPNGKLPDGQVEWTVMCYKNALISNTTVASYRLNK